MKIQSLISHILSFPKKIKGNSIFSPQEFLSIIDRERGRTDRTGNPFALLIYDIPEINRDQKSAVKFIDLIKKRIRYTDEIGWLASNSIGLALPNTPFEGASALQNDIKNILQFNNLFFSSQIYVYPDSWFSPLKDLYDKSYNRTASVENSFTINTDQNLKIETPKNKHNDLALNFSKQHIPLWKRTLDIIGSAFGLILLSPLFVAISAIIKSVSRGPVFFKQERVGCRGILFILWKFRTMHEQADPNVHAQYINSIIADDKPLEKYDGHDPRIFPFGKFLRKTGLDELPQLINVLRGEMSLIGPRPDVPYVVENYRDWQLRRFEVNPGISGLWQINGKNVQTFTDMIRLDIQYTRQSSMWLDIKILVMTFPAVFKLITAKTR